MARSVLITGARAAAALDLARDFAAAGWDVHLGDCVTVHMARWSRLRARHHRYPAPRQQPQAFRTCIADLVTRHAIDLVVPACEEVFHLAAPSLHAQLGERLFAPDLARLRQLHDKLAFACACHEWGLPAPQSHAIDDAAALESFLQASQDWVFKPRFSRFGDRTLISPNRGELKKIRIDAETSWMAQRRIRGDEACFQAIARHGRLVAFAAYRSDWRLGGGARYAFEPLDGGRNHGLRAIAETMARRANMHGQFACDAMFDRNGKPFLLECNPRATSGIHLMAGQGDLAMAIADGAEITGNTSRPAFLGPAMWAFGLPLALRTGRLGEWRSLLAAGHDVISRPGDPAPVAGALIDAAKFLLRGVVEGISTNAATTHDIEWNGEDLDQ